MSENPLVELQEWNRDNVIALALRLRALKAAHLIKYTDLMMDCGLAHRDRPHELALAQQRFSRWIKRAETSWQSLPDKHYKAILSYLHARPKLWAESGSENPATPARDAMYQSMASWLGMENRSFCDLRDNFSGHYTVYRHSLLKPGFIVVGSLEISHDDLSRSIKTLERYHVDSSPVTPATAFEFSGFMFRRNGNYRIITKQTGDDEMQNIFIPHVVAQGGIENARHIIKMRGVVSDVQSGEYYSTRICFVRGAPEVLRTVKAEQIPQELKADLQTPIKLIADSEIAVF